MHKRISVGKERRKDRLKVNPEESYIGRKEATTNYSTLRSPVSKIVGKENTIHMSGRDLRMKVIGGRGAGEMHLEGLKEKSIGIR